jgi:hypothetical protein
VHVFWSDKYNSDSRAPAQQVEQGDTLYHMFWDGQQWSQPLDIILKNPQAVALVYPYATIGADDQIYLTWSGVNGLYFSHAPALNAHNATSWQPAQAIAEGLGVDQSCLILDSSRVLHVAYAKLESDLGGNIAYVRSADGGVTWSLPQALSEIRPNEDKVSAAPQMVQDAQGWLHLVWAERSAPDWIGSRILYARSEDDGETWTIPEPLAEIRTGEKWADVPRVAATGDGNLHVVWVCGAAAHRCYRASDDGGRTWSPTERIFGGLMSKAGWDAMVADHEGSLHLIAQLRYPMGIYYAFKLANGPWNQPIRVVSQPGFEDGHFPHAALSGGNQLHAVWQKDAQHGDVVYLRGTTAASPLTPVEIPTGANPVQSTADHPTPTANAFTASEGTERPPAPSQEKESRPTDQPTKVTQPLLLGVFPAVILVALAVGVQLRRLL